MSLLIKNAQLIDQEIVNIFIKDKLIYNIGYKTPLADQTVDAQGKVVMPGLIDPHVHFRIPGARYKEDWITASKAAAAGGITTVLDMPNNQPAIITQKILEYKRHLIQKQKPYVNYGLYIGATASNLEELKRSRKIAGIKIYLSSTTGDLLVTDYDVVKAIMSNCPQIVAFHSEEESCLIQNQKLKVKIEKYGKSIVEMHNELRPEKCAVESTKQIIEIVNQTNHLAYVCHVSTQDELELIKQAKEQNLPIIAEATPQHLFLDHNNTAHLNNYAKVNPPIRSAQSRKALLQGINQNLIDAIGTDHAPHTKDEKEQDFSRAPSGLPGVETLLPLLLNAYHHHKISLSTIVKLTSANPSKIFNIPKRGFLEPGYFADLIIVDLNLTKSVKNSKLYSKCGWSPFDGWSLTGWPVITIINGQVVYKEYQFINQPNGDEVF